MPPFGHLLWALAVDTLYSLEPPLGATANYPLHSPVRMQWPQLSHSYREISEALPYFGVE